MQIKKLSQKHFTMQSLAKHLYHTFAIITGLRPNHLNALTSSRNSTNGTISTAVSIRRDDIKLFALLEIKNIKSIAKTIPE